MEILSETKLYLEYISNLFSLGLTTEEMEELSLIESNVKYLTFSFSNSEIEYINSLLEKYKG